MPRMPMPRLCPGSKPEPLSVISTWMLPARWKHPRGNHRQRFRFRSRAQPRHGHSRHGRARALSRRAARHRFGSRQGRHRDRRNSGATATFTCRKQVMKKIRVLLADDHKLIRGGLRLLVEQQPDLIVIGEANDGREAVSQAKSLKPDVVVMDIGMPNLNGIEAALQITQTHPEISIVMLSMHSDESYVLRALKSGAKGYLL